MAQKYDTCNDIQNNIALVALSSDELLPGLGALANDLHGVLFVLAFATEGELVLWLSVWDLVDAEPFIGGTEETRQVTLDVLDVVELGSQWIVDVNDHDLPVGLTLVEESHNTEDLDLLDFSALGDGLTNLANVEWVVVTLGLGLWVRDVGVLPGLSYHVRVIVFLKTECLNMPEGKHRSSRCNPCGGSSCGRIAACPSWCPA